MTFGNVGHTVPPHGAMNFRLRGFFDSPGILVTPSASSSLPYPFANISSANTEQLSASRCCSDNTHSVVPTGKGIVPLPQHDSAPEIFAQVLYHRALLEPTEIEVYNVNDHNDNTPKTYLDWLKTGKRPNATLHAEQAKSPALLAKLTQVVGDGHANTWKFSGRWELSRAARMTKRRKVVSLDGYDLFIISLVGAVGAEYWIKTSTMCTKIMTYRPSYYTNNMVQIASDSRIYGGVDAMSIHVEGQHQAEGHAEITTSVKWTAF
ncbi:hypothetical protein CcaCcLH18_12136 [Colletotrichum camelliae]|nr:hypothetical protein CcaCcLH18_12136 [Colletotrichum camelliae]